jgi:hypothetical protein
MKRITCRFQPAENWQETEDYIVSSYSTEHFDLDPDVEEPGVLVFYGRDAAELRHSGSRMRRRWVARSSWRSRRRSSRATSGRR